MATAGTKPTSIHERMVAILAALPAIGKNQQNTQQNFMYRGHDDVLNALNPLLAEHGVFIVPNVLERHPGERQTARGHTMYEVNLLVEYTFFGAAGDSVVASAWGEGTDSGDKATNKAMTMAFKNVLAQAFAISTAELSDADGETPEPTTRNRPAAGGKKPDAKPKVALIEGAMTVKTKEDAEVLRAAEHDLDRRQAWPEIEDYLCLHVFGKKRTDLNTAEKTEMWIRLANAVARAWQLAGGGDFPPPTHEQIVSAYAEHFNDVRLVLRPPAEGEAADGGSVAGDPAAPESAPESEESGS